ncbi:MAG: methane monooxygenase/ammonia monooxygenase subunit B [Candidatus Binatia bacterium]|nr:methane monooxygenase/ammonia monooxygenase subunit B [Candidatus Binatia bacterium]
MVRRFLAGLVMMAVAAIPYSPQVWAHGEAGDEPFLKNLTTAFYDVSISPLEIEVGQPVTITGRVKILETWPHTLYPPEIASIVPVVPGPVFALQDRTVNDQPSTGSFFVEKGGIYQFKLVILGREPGRWHVHPGIAVRGTGTLIGPGEWVQVRPSSTPFAFPVTLLNGQTINLETYGGQFVWWWSFAGFVLGMAWLLYWTLTKRTVTNLAVTSQLPVNDDAPDIGLITPRDHMWMNVVVGLTLVLLVVGWTYATTNYPVRIPQQTDWITPRPISSGEQLAEISPRGATYDEATDTLVMTVQVKNLSQDALTIQQFIMAMATFVNGGAAEQAQAGPRDFVGQLMVEPNSPIASGETKELTFTITSPLFREERLIPLSDPQQFIAGLVRLGNAHGSQQLVTIRTNVIPTQFRSQLPL